MYSVNQTKFSSRSRGWVELPSDSDCRSCLKMRLDHGLKNTEDSRRLSQASQSTSDSSRQSSQDRSRLTEPDICNINLYDKASIMALFEDKLEVRVTDIPLTLSMSSVTGLTDLAEDEVIPKPIPMQIYLENISLRLNEDRPPNNITSPGPVPIDLSISKLRISRDTNGVFYIEPAVGASGDSNFTATTSDSGNVQSSKDIEQELELNVLRQSSKQLRSDNEELRRRLVAFERLSEENSKLRRAKEESEVLRSCLNAAQEDVTTLLEEKRTLQETVTELQNQLTEGGSENSNKTSWSIKR